MNIEETLKMLKEAGIVVNGDLVLEKHVENEIGNVEEGGIGIQIIQGNAVAKQCAPAARKKSVGTTLIDDTFHYAGLKMEGGTYRLVALFQKLIEGEWLDSGSKPDEWLALFAGKPAKFSLVWKGKQQQLYGLFGTINKRKLITKDSPKGMWEIVGSHFVDGNNQGKTFTGWKDLKVGKEDQGMIDYMVDIIDIGKEMPEERPYKVVRSEVEEYPKEESCIIEKVHKYTREEDC